MEASNLHADYAGRPQMIYPCPSWKKNEKTSLNNDLKPLNIIVRPELKLRTFNDARFKPGFKAGFLRRC